MQRRGGGRLPSFFLLAFSQERDRPIKVAGSGREWLESGNFLDVFCGNQPLQTIPQGDRVWEPTMRIVNEQIHDERVEFRGDLRVELTGAGDRRRRKQFVNAGPRQPSCRNVVENRSD